MGPPMRPRLLLSKVLACQLQGVLNRPRKLLNAKPRPPAAALEQHGYVVSFMT